ncbi:hypothetical protein PR048_019299 [Dryococelus australis]|uniref:TTF-type domain-containing protein n=1 Tax=Dryococelus australis TaxID=614101 RepID=A0ABQ9H344_9NEOP|nr:hypothetical protein PR048_019299 [Dryococelus australis]
MEHVPVEDICDVGTPIFPTPTSSSHTRISNCHFQPDCASACESGTGKEPDLGDGKLCNFYPSIDLLDIGNCAGSGLSSKLSTEEKFKFLKKCSIPPLSFPFPVISQGNKNRKFRRDWLVTYSWLIYSAKDNRAYCKMCVLYGSDYGGEGDQQLGILCLKPLIKYKDAISDF